MNPVIIEDSISIAANTVQANVIALNASLRRYLRAPFNSAARLLAVANNVGLTIDFDYGSKNVAAGCVPRNISNIEDPIDVINEQFFPREGDQLVLRASNTTGGAITLRYRLVLQESEEAGPDCRVMQAGPISIAAAAVDVQLLDGLRYSRPPTDCLLDVFMTMSATGLIRTLDVDTENVAPPSSFSATNRIPQDPFDGTISGVEVPEDKLISLAVSNPTGGALSVFWKTKLYELVRT